MSDDHVEVFHLFLSTNAYIESHPDTGLLRLAPSIFRRGAEHIVIAERADLYTGDGEILVVVRSGFWSDVPANVEQIRRLIESERD